MHKKYACDAVWNAITVYCMYVLIHRLLHGKVPRVSLYTGGL